MARPPRPEGMQVLAMFRYKDLQELTILLGKLEEAVLVLRLNLDTLRDVYDYYKRHVQSVDIRADFRDHMERSTSSFLRRLSEIIRSLEIRRAQLESLGKRLDSGRGLVRVIEFFCLCVP